MIPQVMMNGILAGLTWGLVGLGFALVFRAGRFFNFAHGAVFTTGAYFNFIFSTWLGCPWAVSIILAILSSAALGCLVEFFPYRPLRRKGASPLVLLVASLGMYLLLQNTISMIFGDETKIIRSGYVREGLSVFGARITPVQILTICVSVVLLFGIAILSKRTRMGKAMRAVASDPELARVSGIDSDRVILMAFAIGSTIAGIAGTLVAFDVDMTPTMGMNALMMGIVAVIIGGVDSIIGIALGALVLGLAQNLGVWFLGSQWQDAIAFAFLLIFLLFRPQGFLGRQVARTTV